MIEEDLLLLVILVRPDTPGLHHHIIKLDLEVVIIILLLLKEGSTQGMVLSMHSFYCMFFTLVGTNEISF